MANYTSTHTGSAIDAAVNVVEDGTFKSVVYGVTPPQSTSNNAIPTTEWVSQHVTQMITFQHPIGYIFEWSNYGLLNAPDLSTPEKVRQYFGYGTWERFAVGRVAVGYDPNDALFNNIGNEGGTKNAVVVAHTHTQKSHSHTLSNFSDGSGKEEAYKYTTKRKRIEKTTSSVAPAINSTGVDGTNQNLQPYIVIYKYRRVS